MAENIIQIILKGIDELTPVVKGGQDSLTTLGNIAASQVAMQLGQTLTNAVNEVKSALSGMQTGTEDYIDTLNTMAITSGQSIDQMARMNEIAGEAQVSSDQLQMALKLMAQKGLTPNIDGLAALADQYNALPTAQAKAAWGQENFGRSWVNVAKLLDEGGAAIKANAAAVDAAIIPTEAQMKATDALYASQYQLNAEWKAAQMQIMTALAPALTQLADEGAELIKSTLVPMAEWFGKLPDWAKTGTVVFGGIALGLASMVGPALQAFAQIAQISILFKEGGLLAGAPAMIDKLAASCAAWGLSLGWFTVFAMLIAGIIKLLSDNKGTLAELAAVIGYKTLGIDPTWAVGIKDEGAFNLAPLSEKAAAGNGFASGGRFFAGQPMTVGERGPETIIPLTGGNVIPNGGGNGGVNIGELHLHIDGINLDTEDNIRKAAPTLKRALRYAA